MFNEPSLSVSLPPSLYCLSSSLSRPSSTFFFPHFILVCPSLPLSCRLTDTAYWFRMSSECWRGRRRWRRGGRGGRGGGGGGLICILFPSAAQPPSGLDQSSPNTSFVFSRSTFSHCLRFCNLLIPAALFTWRDSSVWGGSTISRITSGNLVCVFRVWKACSGTVPAPKCSQCNWQIFLARGGKLRKKKKNAAVLFVSSTVTAVIV